MSNQKSYLDIFLDNSVEKTRGIYFEDKHERAIIDFNSKTAGVTDSEKLKLFNEMIEPAFRRIVSGVLEMPMFHYLGKINREDLIDAAFFRLVEKMHKFDHNMIGKNGKPVKAYSYFSTVAKNYILEYKMKFEKIQSHKADVESSIDLSILSEDTLEKMTNQDRDSVSFDNHEQVFNETRNRILKKLDEILVEEELKEDKKDYDLLKIGYTIKYLIKNWHKIEFMKKNEFMRLLALYTGLKQQRVSFLFKKFKSTILEILNPKLLKSTLFDEDEDEEKEKKITKKQKKEQLEEETEEEKKINKIVTIEDFEIYSEREENEKIKSKWQTKNQNIQPQ